MEFVLVLRELLGRRRLLAAGLAIAAIAAVLSVYRVDGASLKSRNLQYSSASTQVLVDAPASVLSNLSQSFEPLVERALVYANFMASPAVLEFVGKQAGIPGNQIYAAGPVNATLPRVEQEPTDLKRNVQITGETKPYRLAFNSDPRTPTISIFARAPSTHQAIALANGAAAGLKAYVANDQAGSKVPVDSRVTIRQLGPATGGVVDGGVSKSLAFLVFVGVFVLWCLLLLAFERFASYWQATSAGDEAFTGGGEPVPVVTTVPLDPDDEAEDDDDDDLAAEADDDLGVADDEPGIAPTGPRLVDDSPSEADDDPRVQDDAERVVLGHPSSRSLP
jgi:hypothetical protein